MSGVNSSLKVNEIFLSIQGEGTRAGMPCVLIRLTGCNLRCSWCDTEYARNQGRRMSIDQVLTRIEPLACRLVAVTGGEPLLQPATPELLRRLCDAGYATLLETNGSLDISPVDHRVVKIVDFKCPASGQQENNRWANLEQLTQDDEVKFVIADREDYDFARQSVAARNITGLCTVMFAPVHGRLDPASLAQWILADSLDVRLSMQLHRIIWPDRDRQV